MRNVVVCETNNKCVKQFLNINVKDQIAELVLNWIQSNDKKIALSNELNQFHGNININQNDNKPFIFNK